MVLVMFSASVIACRLVLVRAMVLALVIVFVIVIVFVLLFVFVVDVLVNHYGWRLCGWL